MNKKESKPKEGLELSAEWEQGKKQPSKDGEIEKEKMQAVIKLTERVYLFRKNKQLE